MSSHSVRKALHHEREAELDLKKARASMGRDKDSYMMRAQTHATMALYYLTKYSMEPDDE